MNNSEKKKSSSKSTDDVFDRLSKTDTYTTKDTKGKIERSAPKKVDTGKKTTVRTEDLFCNWKPRLPKLVFNTYSPLGRMIFLIV